MSQETAVISFSLQNFVLAIQSEKTNQGTDALKEIKIVFSVLYFSSVVYATVFTPLPFMNVTQSGLKYDFITILVIFLFGNDGTSLNPSSSHDVSPVNNISCCHLLPR